MQVLVVYDIEDDNRRTKISNTLKDWGLERIQYSVFTGDLTNKERKELEACLNQLLDPKIQEDSIVTISVCQSCLNNVVSLGSDRQLDQGGSKVVFV